MIRLVTVAGFVLTLATSTQAMTGAPLLLSASGITLVREGCGPGMILVNGACVARSSIRQARRCLRWNGSVCSDWQ